MAVTYHSPNAHSAYIDLRRLLLDEQVSDLRGAPRLKTVGGRAYWYDNYRLGSDQVWTYIGEDTPELRRRLDRQAEIASDNARRRAEQARLVRILRAEGVMGMDARTGSLLSAFARTGVFRLGGTLVGTVAFRTYEAELGVRIQASVLTRTDDIDVASFERLSVALGDQVTEPVQQILSDLKFEPQPSLDGHRVWRWKQAGRETLVEFLTPAFGEEGLRDLPALGVSAQALHYLNFLLKAPIRAVAIYRSGVLIQVPSPERYAIHKLIVADRRRGGTASLKAHKDRAQAAFLIEVLAEDRPDELAEAWEDARARGPRWRVRLDASLARMPETRARLAAVPGVTGLAG
ncbi:MAG: GSU2403 family nucleotidyltransferase fold protein [Paracoccaceae bacterium]